MAEVRYDVFPSRMTLQMFNTRQAAAQRGYSLLKKKSDTLKGRLHLLLRTIDGLKRQLMVDMKTAFFSHTEATYAAGDFNHNIIERQDTARVRVQVTHEHLAGEVIPRFAPVLDESIDESSFGLAKGGRQIGKCRQQFSSVLENLIKLATLETSLKALDDALRRTNRRVNALDVVVIPRLRNTIRYIKSELDEREREDLFRLKKVVENKQSAEREEHEAALAEARLARTRVHSSAGGLRASFADTLGSDAPPTDRLAAPEPQSAVQPSVAEEEIPDMDAWNTGPSLLASYQDDEDLVIDGL